MSFVRKLIPGMALVFAVIGAQCFYVYNQVVNYPPHRVVVRAKAEHPTLIPGRTALDIFGGGFRILAAHAAYIRSMQYVGSFLRTSEYKLHLFDLYSAITDLDPQYADVYVRGPLLLAFSEKSEPFSQDQKKAFAQQGVQLAKKGIQYMCDPVKLAAAAGTGVNLGDLATHPSTANPCGKYDDIPYYLAYILYRYIQDEASAAYWYRIAAAHSATPVVAKYMATMMQGRAGDREKAALTFLSLSVEQGDQECRAIASTTTDLLYPVLRDGADTRLNRTLLRTLTQTLLQLRQQLGAGDLCQQNFGRALREMNLLYVERADKEFFLAKKRHAVDADELLRTGFIEILPVDPESSPQQRALYYWDKKVSHWSWGFYLPKD